MAKVSVKKPATPTPAKKATAPRSKAKASSSLSLDGVCEKALAKLKALNIDAQLQADLGWCLGSYRFDKNPVGLVKAGSRALEILTAAKAKKANSVPTKLISDLKKVLK
ncbi:MAG: hypothetical protein OEU76_05510 [Cyclobacteriaceae bacterium]|nr:hypothetical protein [Cyclobacteriaceae bacterium]